jgi:peptidoglycan/LPS O-acetylase OafA/YrhL
MVQTDANAIKTKPHYPILDGLRGVAAVIVVAFHIFEANATNSYDQIINHGYLAVDFFFVLSGFVIGYAYDDRWTKLTIGGFFKRRLERLQPMVVLGTLIGAACFYFGDSSVFPVIHTVPVWRMLLIMLIGCTLIPIPISWDIRGWQEMHPLDGPAWSLFFEYIANILYALGARKLSKTALTILIIIAGAALIHFTVTDASGDVVGGWSLSKHELRIGFTRLIYPFFAGLLLSRVIKPINIKNAFLLCSLLLCIVFGMPRIGDFQHAWENGLFESLSIIFVFPLIVYLGASGDIKSKAGQKVCKFLGDISYPIYITHYAFVYIYTAWVGNHAKEPHFAGALGYGVLTFVVSITVAYLSLKYYDEPVRAWLKRKWK